MSTSKGLEALERITNHIDQFDSDKYIADKKFSNDYITIEKELKALEIIKTKQVSISWCGGLPPLLLQTYSISREEYDLLQEVLL